MSTTRFDPPYPKLEDVDGDGYIVPGENDISRDQKRTLGSYISSVTRARVPSDEVIEFAGSIPERANTFPVAEGESRTKGFTDLVGERVADTFEYSSSGVFDGRPSGDLNDLIAKGTLGEGNNPTVRPNTLGHYMLNRPATAKAGAEIVDATNSASPARPSFPDQDTTRASSRATVADTLGEEGLSSSYDPRADRISIEDIRSSTLDMLLAATGKNRSHRDISGYEDSLIKAGVEPSTVQSGIARVDVNDMRPAKYVPVRDMNSTTRRMSGESGSTDAVITTDGLGEDRYTSRSSGAAYSPFEPFTSPLSGVSTFGVVSLAIFASVAAVSAVVLGFQKLSSLTGAGALTPSRVMTGNFLSPAPLLNRQDEVLDLALGKYELENKATPTFPGNLFNLVSEGLQAIGAPDFYNPISGRNYFECAMLGYIAFLGANPDDDAELGENVSFLTITLQFIKRSGILLLLKQQRGYYETIFRNISRNINALINSTRADPATFLSTGGIESLFSAGIVDIVQIFAKTGDMLYLRYDASKNFKLGGPAGTSFSDSAFDSLLNSGDAGPSKNDFSSYKKFAASRTRSQRTSGGSRNTSMDGAQIPALRLLPEKYHSLIRGSPTTVSSMLARSGELLGTDQQPKVKNRFTEEQVAEIEDLLESEYMPFYFQDLRTNEIISFNAFLDDVSDGFQAEYSSISGYGRIEDAKIYKGTKRSLGVKFHLFASNPDDFDSMWWQINKLTTMVYPQWSRGRELQIVQGNDVKNKAGQAKSQTFPFIQPFSQIPTATPVVRVRVGDLIRSNYSRFNLKRLFGFKDSVVGPKQESAGGQFSTGTEDVLAKTVVTRAAVLGSPGRQAQKIPLTVKKDTYVANIAGMLNAAGATVKAGTVLEPRPGGLYSLVISGKTYGVERSKIKDVAGGYTTAAQTKVEGQTEQTKEVGGSVGTITPDGNSMTAAEFYHSDKNAIIRSFESTMGKGLAAVCTSLKFGWMDAPWGAGEDGPGYRAPRYCTVDMQFDVMHDIAPGLDADGFNRAPIYPVGDTIPRIIEGAEPNPYGRGTKSSQDTRIEYNNAINMKK